MKYVYACVREYIHMGERDRDNESSYVCVFNIHKTVGITFTNFRCHGFYSSKSGV